MHDFWRSLILLVLLVAALIAGSPPLAAGDRVPLAIKGYDPVAYLTVGRPTRGLPELEYEWDEHRYRFSSIQNRELFKADPVRYAPQFANFCALALSRGELHEADPENWLISEGKLYIFGGPQGPAMFRQAATENIVKANENRELLRKQ